MTGNNILYDHGTDYERLINSLPPPQVQYHQSPSPTLPVLVVSYLFQGGGDRHCTTAQIIGANILDIGIVLQFFRILGQFHSFLGYDQDKFSGHWEKFSGLWNKFSAPLDKITGVGTSEKKFTRSSPGCVPSQVLPLLVQLLAVSRV